MKQVKQPAPPKRGPNFLRQSTVETENRKAVRYQPHGLLTILAGGKKRVLNVIIREPEDIPSSLMRQALIDTRWIQDERFPTIESASLLFAPKVDGTVQEARVMATLQDFLVTRTPVVAVEAHDETP